MKFFRRSVPAAAASVLSGLPPTGPVSIFWPRAAAPLQSLANTARVALFLVVGVLVLRLFSDFLLLVFLAVLFAVLLRGLADRLRHVAHLPDWLSLLVVVLGLLLVGGAAVSIEGPRFADQGRQLVIQLSQAVTKLHETYGSTQWGRAITSFASPGASAEASLAHSAASVAGSTLGAIASAIVVIFTALYFAISPRLYIEGLLYLLPPTGRPRGRQILHDIGHTLQWWLLGQGIDMLVVGILTGIGLSLVGVPLSLALGALAGLLTFVPYFGTVVVAIPALAVAMVSGGTTKLLWVLAIFAAVHAIEGYVISPLIQRRTVHLPPALTILSMAILGGVFGPLGIVLATPLCAALLVLVREAYVGDVLGDPSAAPPPTQVTSTLAIRQSTPAPRKADR